MSTLKFLFVSLYLHPKGQQNIQQWLIQMVNGLVLWQTWINIPLGLHNNNSFTFYKFAWST